MSELKSTTRDAAPQTAPVHSPAFALTAAAKSLRPKRDAFVGFVRDDASIAVLHRAMAPAFPNGLALHKADFRASLKILGGMTTPEVVLVDVSGEDQPINAVMDLAEVVEPGTIVLVVGEIQNVHFYRTVTKGMGVKEYLAKPLTEDLVRKNFGSLFKQVDDDAAKTPRGGRMITVAGVRGGVGCSTIATNLAWLTGTQLHRHTLLLDADLHTGTTALNLNVRQDKGLFMALESPDRMDSLLLERSTQQAAERLHVLSASEALTTDAIYVTESAARLTKSVCARYNFVVADAGARLSPFARDLIHFAHQRVVVLDPSVIAIRNLERLAMLPAGPQQSPRPVLVLNMAGGGSLTQAAMERTIGRAFDAVIPDLPRIVSKALQYGTPAAELRGPFRDGIGKLAEALGAGTAEAPAKQKAMA